MCETVQEMLPLKDRDFVLFLRQDILPSAADLSLLGAFSSCVILCAPFLELLGPDDAIMLPEGVEDFDVAAMHRAIDEWDEHDDGRS